MKKLMTLMLGLTLVLASSAFGADDKKADATKAEHKEKKAKKKSAKKADDAAKPADAKK